MELAEVYPKPAELLSNERGTLKFLMDHAFDFPDLLTGAREAYFRNNTGPLFEFESHIDVEHEGQRLRVWFGVTILVNSGRGYDNVSYYTAVCYNATGSGNILRKFHFDLALQGRARRRPHPLFHLQYCGGLSRRLLDQGYSVDHMDKWLSEPRLWYTPMSLALLLHCMLREFSDETAFKFSNKTEWQMLVKKNEDLILRPYFEKSSEFLRTEERKTKLFTDSVYVS